MAFCAFTFINSHLRLVCKKANISLKSCNPQHLSRAFLGGGIGSGWHLPNQQFYGMPGNFLACPRFVIRISMPICSNLTAPQKVKMDWLHSKVYSKNGALVYEFHTICGNIAARYRAFAHASLHQRRRLDNRQLSSVQIHRRLVRIFSACSG